MRITIDYFKANKDTQTHEKSLRIFKKLTTFTVTN